MVLYAIVRYCKLLYTLCTVVQSRYAIAYWYIFQHCSTDMHSFVITYNTTITHKSHNF